MRMARLSAETGVAAPTIRYYIREGLVPPGTLTSPNQAVYDDTHVRALRLTRALIDIGGLSIDGARKVLAHLAEKADDTYSVLGSTQYALTAHRDLPESEEAATATARVDQLIQSRGWSVRPDNPARTTLADTLLALNALGATETLELLDTYAVAAENLAEHEVEQLLDAPSIESAVVGVIACDVLGDRLLSALRRLAQENAVTSRLATPNTG